MKVLLINYFFYPIVNPRSIRWLYFTKHLVNKGCQVDVLTVNPNKNFASYIKNAEKSIPGEVRIIRSFAGPLHYLQAKLTAGGETNPKGKQSSERRDKKVPKVIRKLLLDVWRKIFKDLIIPDKFVDWLPFGFIKGLTLMSLHRYDCIISSGMPFTDHLIAYCLKLIFRKCLWIADYGDPWSFCN